MKKIILLLSFLFLLNQISYSQNFWAYTAGSVKEDEAMDICYDNSGNIISAGYFSGATNFGGGSNLSSSTAGIADIYISKSSPSGQVLWATKAGGNGSDRAISVKADAFGNIYITGFYFGIAKFGAITLTSASGSQDGFIAKLDPLGNFIWAKSFGGNLAEWGNSITVDKSGNPIVTGQFQGTSNFSGTILTSKINPNTSFSSFDVFVAKYDSAGTIQWVNKGSSKFDDRGLDIITDNFNNIYVCGQFSDTIQFQNIHHNYIMNATFIVKYDSTGQEKWFKKAAGVFSIPYSMVMDNTENIYITGDFQGTFTYFGSTPNFLNGTYSKKTYLIKIDNAGNYLWGKSESSNNYISSKQVALDPQQNPYIFGEFTCTMTEYSNATASGSFNSIGFQDFFITKYNNTGTRQWFKHYGGARNDKAHGLLLAGINQPIMAGSYEHALNMPSSNNISVINNPITPNNLAGPNQPSNYCGAPTNYNQYTHLTSKGYSDAFIFKGFDITRDYYDYYERTGSLCNINFVGSCITKNINSLSCPDTINVCKQDTIWADTKTGSDGYFGPLHKFTWNNSATDTLQKLFKTTSGYNTVKVSTIDGCYKSVDTVYVQIRQLPAPTITDNLGINNSHPNHALPITVCGPATITLTGGNIQNASIQWTGGNITSTQDSSAMITSTGTYSLLLTTAYGCVDTNHIVIHIDSILPLFAPKQKTDSLDICSNEPGMIHIYDTISNPSGSAPVSCIPYTDFFTVSSTPGLMVHPLPFNDTYCDLSLIALPPSTSGTYSYTIGYILNNACMSDTIYYTDSIYIHVKPAPFGLLSITGNTLMCPGDSTTITATASNLNSINTIFTISPSAIFVTADPDTYYFNLNLEDSVSKCRYYVHDSIVIKNKPNPFIITNPYNSIICPNDSVTLTVDLPNALTYEWFGPQGAIPGNSQTIYSQTSGFYHCIVTDITGCIFITNAIEIKNYSTPFLLNFSSVPLCTDQSTTIQVITLDTTLIVWNAPFSGGGATKTITSPGVYSCEVTMCGITSSLSINVIGSTPTATIAASGPTTICPFDSVTLSGNSNMVNYIWQPGNYIGQNYTVHSADSYTLEITDIYGCTSISTPVTVSYSSSIAPPISTTNDTICAGQTATLNANASGGNQIDWFANNNMGPILASGNNFTTLTLNDSITYYAAAVSSTGCHSTGVPVSVFIYETSLLPQLIADTSLCRNDTIHIIGQFINGASYAWSGPNGVSSSGNTLSIPNAIGAYSGIYNLIVSGFGCTSQTASITINVTDPQIPNISTLDSICENTNYSNAINPIDPNYSYNWAGPNGYTGTSGSLDITNAALNQSGIYSVTSSYMGCVSAPNSLTLTVVQKPIDPIISFSPFHCIGDTILLNAIIDTNFTYNWYGPNGFSSATTNTYVVASDTTISGYYGIIGTNQFCYSNTVSNSIKIYEYPSLIATSDTLACDSEPLVLNGSSNYPNYTWSTGSNNSSINVTESGTYWIKAQNGVCSTTDTIQVSIINCAQIVINVFTPNGDGVNDLFMFSSPAIKEIHCEVRNRWGEKMGEFNSPKEGWNGNSIVTNAACEEGTYFYTAVITTIEGIIHNAKGFVTLFR